MSNWNVEERPEGVIVRDRTRQYAFVSLSLTDVHGTDLEGVADPVVFVGETLSVHYINGKTLSSVPRPYLDAVRDRGYAIINGVDGGWKSWEGRPEWSETYLDLADASVWNPDDDDDDDDGGA